MMFLKKFKYFLIILLCGFDNSAKPADGGASDGGGLIVFPISQYVVNKTDTSLKVVNTTKLVQKFKYEKSCAINGLKYNGDECDKFFKFDLSDVLIGNIITLNSNIQLDKKITLLTPPAGEEKDKPFYALFTPVFTVLPPETEENRKNNTVTFEFKYAPGALFIFNPADEPLPLTSFTSKISAAGVRSVAFSFDVSKLSMAQVVSLNAKITDAKSGLLIRFLSLAKEKIVDPNRKIFVQDGNVDNGKGETDTLCYTLYVQNISLQKAYVLSSDNPLCVKKPDQK